MNAARKDVKKETLSPEEAKKKQQLEELAKLPYKAVSIGDYIIKATEKFGSDNVRRNCIALLFSENEVVGNYLVKNEMFFVCKK